MFAMKFNVFMGYSGFQASFFVVGPGLRQKQSIANRYRMFFETQNGKNACLAIFGFTESAAPLPSDTNGFISLFGNAGFVNYQTAIVFTANKPIRIIGKLIDNRLVIPWRIGQKVLKDLIVRIWNRFSHTFHVLFIRLDQAFEILFRDAANIACT